MIHHLKTVQPYYDAVVSGMKTFDIRVADRDFQVGDRLVLQEFVDGALTDREQHCIVTYVMSDPQYVLPGSVVLGIRELALGDPSLEELKVEAAKTHIRVDKTFYEECSPYFECLEDGDEWPCATAEVLGLAQ